MMVQTFNSSTQKADYPQFKASLVYMVSSRIATVMQKDPVSKVQSAKTKEKKKKPKLKFKEVKIRILKSKLGNIHNKKDKKNKLNIFNVSTSKNQLAITNFIKANTPKEKQTQNTNRVHQFKKKIKQTKTIEITYNEL